MRRFLLFLLLLCLMPISVQAEKPAMGQWGFTYGVFDNRLPGGMKDFHFAGFQFYFPVNRYVAIGPSGFFNGFETDWPKLPRQEGFGCDFWLASLDIKISTFPYRIINPYFIFHLGAYDLKPELPAVFFREDSIFADGTHAFAAGSFGLEFTLKQFVIGGRATGMTYEKIKMGSYLHTKTDVNWYYTAFAGFHYKL